MTTKEFEALSSLRSYIEDCIFDGLGDVVDVKKFSIQKFLELANGCPSGSLRFRFWTWLETEDLDLVDDYVSVEYAIGFLFDKVELMGWRVVAMAYGRNNVIGQSNLDCVHMWLTARK